MVARDASRSSASIIQDPAAGTGGFLIAADRYIKRRTDDLSTLDRGAAAQVPAQQPSTAWSSCRTRTGWR